MAQGPLSRAIDVFGLVAYYTIVTGSPPDRALVRAALREAGERPALTIVPPASTTPAREPPQDRSIDAAA